MSHMHELTTFTTQFDPTRLALGVSRVPHDHRQMVHSALHHMTLTRPAVLHQINDASAITRMIAGVFAIVGIIIQQVQSLK